MSGGRIPKRNTDAINRAQKEGHLFILNTGRAKAFIPDYALRDISFDGIVAGSGMYCSYGAETLREFALDTGPLVETAGYFIKRNREFLIEGQTKLLYRGEKYRDFPGFENLNDPKMISEKYADENFEKLLVFGQADESEIAFMSERFETECIPSYSECSNKGVNKGDGFRLIAKKLGKDYTTVAIGDSVNDISSFREADISVAVDNAPEEIKQFCDMSFRKD